LLKVRTWLRQRNLARLVDTVECNTYIYVLPPSKSLDVKESSSESRQTALANWHDAIAATIASLSREGSSLEADYEIWHQRSCTTDSFDMDSRRVASAHLRVSLVLDLRDLYAIRRT
jgi:hypothetical protein